MTLGRKQPEADRTRREPGELVSQAEEPGAPPADEEEYVPAKARLEDDEEELASHSDDVPAVE